MARGFEAITKVTIHASKRDVWNALTNPEKVRQYMHGTERSTDWKEGSPIFWRGEWKGRTYEDKGTVVAVEPQKMVKVVPRSTLGETEERAGKYSHSARES